MPEIPPPPLPRSDLPPPAGLSDADYKDYLGMLAEEPVGAWIDQDGTLHLHRMPASMAPAGVRVDSPVAIAPDDPDYERWAGTVEPEYDFQQPTPVAPEPRPQPQRKETPDAASTDGDTERG